MTTLSKEEKVQLIESRVKNLEYKKYGLELDALVENAKVTPDQNNLDAIDSAVSEINTQLSALNAELVLVNAE